MNYCKTLILIFLSFVTFLKSETVYRVPIQSTIDLGLPNYIERSIEEAVNDNADAIIFDLNTFGGRVDGATQIKDEILNSPILTVAFINKRAISAGALISLSCDKIYMTSGGIIGAATAVDMSGNKGSEKVISYMREEMASTAESNGKNSDIARGMVDEDLYFDYLFIDGDSIYVDDIEGRKAGKLISLTTNQAIKYSIADGSVETFKDLLKEINLENAKIVDFSINWTESLRRFLTDPTVSSLLMTLGFLGLLFEIQSPGWGIPGSIGILSLLLFFGSTIDTGLATGPELIVVGIGILLLLLEFFIIPGFGLLGISGLIVILGGLFMLLIPENPLTNDYNSASWAFAISTIGGIISIFLIFRLLSKTKFWEKLTLPTSQKSSEGYNTSIGLEGFVGKLGISTSDLRPSGWGEFDAKKLFVVTEGEFVDRKEKIEILSVDGNRILVRKISN